MTRPGKSRAVPVVDSSHKFDINAYREKNIHKTRKTGFGKHKPKFLSFVPSYQKEGGNYLRYLTPPRTYHIEDSRPSEAPVCAMPAAPLTLTRHP